MYASLLKSAQLLRNTGGEDRTHQQIMADLLVTAITGAEQAHLVPVTVNMTITADALLRAGSEPAFLDATGRSPPYTPEPSSPDSRPPAGRPTNGPAHHQASNQ